jgi:tripartite-type tricarboxylate transporter receptor subunit TctC
MRRRTLLATAFAAGAAGLGTRRAAARAAFPSRALTLIVPFSPGTSVGVNARLLQPHLEQALGQSVELAFNQGAGGLAGHLLGAEAAADGYTLTLVSASLTTQPWLNRASTAKPDDFAFIGRVTALPSVLLVRADSPHHTLADLVAALRARPESLTTGTMVGWWPPALAQALFTTQAAIKPRVVSSYYGGADLVEALSQRQLDFVVVGLADAGPSLAGGKLRVLAVSGRTGALPAIPSFREQGWNVTTAWWRGLAAPKGTPAEAIARLDTALRDALDGATLHADFDRAGLPVDPLDAASFGKFVQDEYQTIGGLFSLLGLNVQTPRPT